MIGNQQFFKVGLKWGWGVWGEGADIFPIEFFHY